MTDAERIEVLERRVDELTRLVVTLTSGFNNHDHRIRVPNEDPYNPFSNYTESETVVRGQVVEIPEHLLGV
jgi:hypothetical protein